MRVLPGDEQIANDVLIGQMKSVKSFEVSNDAAMMSLLSTGLYENPLKAMLQEILFNAWDAHKRSNKQDVPVDVYIYPQQGLTIADYGSGIAPENMHQTYCVYGHSDKRDSDNETGGFGLGCKSPFAYTETFTVTSHYKGTKTVYIAARVSEEANGLPALTTLIEAPTDRTGLTVNVPIKTEIDARDLLHYISNIVEFSGLRIRLHTEDTAEPQLLYSPALEPFQYKLVSTAAYDFKRNPLVAVYGGVKYPIPHNKKFHKYTEIMENLLAGYSIVVGFEPSSLTPAPSRETINVSSRSEASILRHLELVFKSLNSQIIKELKTLFDFLLEEAKAADPTQIVLSPKYLTAAFIELTRNSNQYPLFKGLYQAKGKSLELPLWVNKEFRDLMNLSTKTIGKQQVANSFYLSLRKAFPQETDDLRLIRQTLQNHFNSDSTYNATARDMKILLSPFGRTNIKTLSQLHDTYTNDPDLKPIYMYHWAKSKRSFQPTHFITPHNVNKNKDKYLQNSSRYRSDILLPDCLYFDYYSLSLTPTNIVFLAPTKYSLKHYETYPVSSTIRDQFVQHFPEGNGQLMYELYTKTRTYTYGEIPTTRIPMAVVAPYVRDTYSKVKEQLEQAGFIIIEIPYEAAEKKPAKIKRPEEEEPTGYPVLIPRNHVSSLISSETFIEKPKVFYYETKTDLYSDNQDVPFRVAKYCAQENPYIAYVNNITKAHKLIEQGAIPVEEYFYRKYQSYKKKPALFRTVFLMSEIVENIYAMNAETFIRYELYKIYGLRIQDKEVALDLLTMMRTVFANYTNIPARFDDFPSKSVSAYSYYDEHRKLVKKYAVNQRNHSNITSFLTSMNITNLLRDVHRLPTEPSDETISKALRTFVKALGAQT